MSAKQNHQRKKKYVPSVLGLHQLLLLVMELLCSEGRKCYCSANEGLDRNLYRRCISVVLTFFFHLFPFTGEFDPKPISDEHEEKLSAERIPKTRKGELAREKVHAACW